MEEGRRWKRGGGGGRGEEEVEEGRRMRAMWRNVYRKCGAVYAKCVCVRVDVEAGRLH